MQLPLTVYSQIPVIYEWLRAFDGGLSSEIYSAEGIQQRDTWKSLIVEENWCY